MNIESANLSSLAPSSGTVVSSSTIEGVLPPSADGSVFSEGFGSALVAQIELLGAIKAGDSMSVQTPNLNALEGGSNASQGVTGVLVNKVDVQDFAALLGNELPPSYKTKDDVDHEAALAAVTDTLKYIAVGTTAGEKAVEAEQNMKDVIAMAAPAEQKLKDTVALAVPAEQNMKNVIAKDVTVTTAPVEQNSKDVVVVAVPVEKNTADAVVEAEQGMKKAAVIDVPVQMDLKQTNDKPDKKQVEEEFKITGVEDHRGDDGLLAAIILPVVMPIEQVKAVNNLAPEDSVKEGVLLSFTKPSTGDAKPNQSAKVPNAALQNEAVFGQPVQNKQDFNLNAGQVEKTGLVTEPQALSLEGEKALPRVGTDITQLNRPVVDNKADVPAITKPLSHPEWSKDLGERIVWMNSKAIPAAEIRLNPQHLGPISVRVDVADDQATVVFTAQHAATREALEASIPKLRDMMGAQQLNLVDVSVSQGSASDQGRSQAQNFAQNFAEGQRQGAARVAGDGVDDVEQEIESGRAVVSKGLLSIYA